MDLSPQKFIDNIRVWTADGIRDELKHFGLNSQGNKTELILRLQTHYRQIHADSHQEPSATASKADSSSTDALVSSQSKSTTGHHDGISDEHQHHGGSSEVDTSNGVFIHHTDGGSFSDRNVAFSDQHPNDARSSGTHTEGFDSQYTQHGGGNSDYNISTTPVRSLLERADNFSSARISRTETLHSTSDTSTGLIDVNASHHQPVTTTHTFDMLGVDNLTPHRTTANTLSRRVQFEATLPHPAQAMGGYVPAQQPMPGGPTYPSTPGNPAYSQQPCDATHPSTTSSPAHFQQQSGPTYPPNPGGPIFASQPGGPGNLQQPGGPAYPPYPGSYPPNPGGFIDTSQSGGPVYPPYPHGPTSSVNQRGITPNPQYTMGAALHQPHTSAGYQGQVNPNLILSTITSGQAGGMTSYIQPSATQWFQPDPSTSVMAYFNTLPRSDPQSRNTTTDASLASSSSLQVHQTPPQYGATSPQPTPSGIPHLASTRLEHDNTPDPHQTELEALERELRILKTRDEIRNIQHRLSIPPEQLSQTAIANHTATLDLNASMLQLVKQSVDISSLPPAKPFVFSGDVIDYPKWKSMFDLLVETKNLLAHQKLVYLEDYLAGEALDSIKGYNTINTDEAYTEARRELDERYGDPFDIVEAYRDRLESWPQLTASDNAGLRKYSNFLKQCTTAMTSISELSRLSDPRQMKVFPNALPRFLLQKWSRFAGTVKFDHHRHPSFQDYADFVKKEAYLATDSTTSVGALTAASKNPSKKVATTRTTVAHNTVVEQFEQTGGVRKTTDRSSQNKAPKTKRCHLCKIDDSHNTSDCRKLSKLPHSEKQDFMMTERLCFRCLHKGHSKTKCNTKLKCAECNESHATSLHDSRKKPIFTAPKAEPTATPLPSDTGQSDASVKVTNHRISSRGSSGLTTMILPVYVSSLEHPNTEVLIYALVDSGSDTSFITTDTFSHLRTKSEPAKLEISTLTTKDQVVRCQKISNLQIRGIKSNFRISIPETYTKQSIASNRDHIPTPETARHWPHLCNLADKISPMQPCEVAMLIGVNCPAASSRISEVKGDLTEPYAAETILGWSIVGGMSNGKNQLRLSHRISTRELTSDEVLDCLQEDLIADHNGTPMSQNDLLFLQKMKDTITTVDGFYTMPLPFKETPTLPDNRIYAMQRFHSLERKLKSDTQLSLKYHEFMLDIIAKGEATPCCSDKSGWYIPHHGVFHPHKPEKLRVVFDCSATYRGQSLNKNLLQGPDLNNNLAGLLCRFRKNKVAFTCDIQKMFHQFRVAKPDRKYLRFLWYKDSKSTEIVDYQMNVHLFGAVSSPSCAIFGLQQLASDYSADYPTASSFIQENFYVDDGLISLPSSDEVIKLVYEAQALTKKGNLVLHKFLSNDATVAETIGCDGPKTKELNTNTNMTRALGLCWNITQDCFRFTDKVARNKATTRRGILSTVASVFDPLGFMTPFTLNGKLILQSLCHGQKGWDDPISQEQHQRWNEWLNNLPDINDFNVRRCYLASNTTGLEYDVELHTFSDACSYAYGACSYLRIIDKSSHQASVSLVMGKSRVAPRKAVTIPRLELQAATLAVKISDFLSRELKYTNMSSYYWTDSETVLGYISNEAKKFQTFVSNRVQRIRDSSTQQQWNHIASKENPADIASRGANISTLPPSWLHGPEFLSDISYHMKERKPREYSLDTKDPEIKKVFILTTQTANQMEFLNQFDRYGSWNRVTKIICKLLKVSKKNTGLHPASPSVFTAIVKMTQKPFFSEDMEKLQRGLPLSKSSSLYKLDPFVDQTGILRVGGRLKDALTTYDLKHPVVMPGKAHTTKLFAYQKHADTSHQGKTTTMNHIRASGVYIVGQGSRMISTMIHKCVRCIRLRGKPVGQKMSDLPPMRTEPAPPFTHVGMDAFGPFACKDGRKEVKRWGLIFTCLASRALHLELLEDMTTDSFINAFRCFTAIRGPVQSLLSDQGTNFVGARNEFKRAMAEMVDDKAKTYLLSKNCIFRFNVPTASHMGGSWERLIRTVRNVMDGTLIESRTIRLDTGALRTLMYECMSIINSRPLSTAPLTQDSTVEPVPLTPNMLLTMKEHSESAPPGFFEEADLYSRKRWRRVQFIAEQFWSRWKVEYLQQLQPRQRWNTIKRNIQTDDIVLLADNEIPRSCWQLARVTGIIPSRDGLIRKVKVQPGAGGELERPIHKLITLVPAASCASGKN